MANNLLGAANPGQVFSSFSTYQRTLPTFDFESHHTEILTDGKPILAYLPISLRYRPGQVRGLPGLRVPMVGRIEDFSLMQTERDRVFSSNQSHIILVSGAAGLGNRITG